MNMLLAIDIGNTNINGALFKKNKIGKRFSIATGDYSLKRLKKSIDKITFKTSIICSVVPKKNKELIRDLKRLTGKRPYLVGKDLIVPMKNLYQRPREVGQDRLVNAYAGVILYGEPLIVVDFGTAVTFDVVSKNREYLGGMILPGLEISLTALTQRTALLPEVKLTRPKEFIGRNTKDSILSGIVFGFSALCDDLTKRIKQKMGGNCKVVATGGNISLIAKYCKNLDEVNRDLTLRGLNFLYQNLIS